MSWGFRVAPEGAELRLCSGMGHLELPSATGHRRSMPGFRRVCNPEGDAVPLHRARGRVEHHAMGPDG